MAELPEIIIPDWQAPTNVRVAITTRQTIGKKKPPDCYGHFNLGFHVGDNPAAVTANWQALRITAALPELPLLINQVHGTTVIDRQALSSGSEADGVYSGSPGVCCAILTADCLPILLCDSEGREVAALHAGWRGLANNIVQAGVRRFTAPPANLCAYLGPAISQAHFEVGDDVRRAYLANASTWACGAAIADCFQAGAAGRWYADLYQLARLALNAAGVHNIGGGNYCTYAEAERFYSYRRDGVTGRMASIIWFD